LVIIVFYHFFKRPPEALNSQVPDWQASRPFQLFTPLLRRRGGWFANDALERARLARRGYNRNFLMSGFVELGSLGHSTMTARVIILAIVFCGVSGCSLARPPTTTSAHPSAATVSVPPERMPLVEAARSMHSKSEYASRYPVLRRAGPTSDGGYEVRFGKAQGYGIIGISYYFDASGHYDHSIQWLCDGY
jgi:hypothetical protein